MNYIYFTGEFQKKIANSLHKNTLIERLKNLGKLPEIGNHKWVTSYAGGFVAYSYQVDVKVVLQQIPVPLPDGQFFRIIAALNVYEARDFEKNWDKINIMLRNKDYPALSVGEIDVAKKEYLLLPSGGAQKPTLPGVLSDYAYLAQRQPEDCDIFESDRWVGNAHNFRDAWKAIGDFLFFFVFDYANAKKKYDMDLHELPSGPMQYLETVHVRIKYEKDGENRQCYISLLHKLVQSGEKNAEQYAFIDIQDEAHNLFDPKQLEPKSLTQSFKALFPKGYALNYLDRNSDTNWRLDEQEVFRGSFCKIQDNSISNIALSQDQIDLLAPNHPVKPPFFINGQAGSGKTVVLYYQYAFHFVEWVKENKAIRQEDEHIKPPVFVTATKELKEKAKEAVFELVKALLRSEPGGMVLLDEFQPVLASSFILYEELLQELLRESELGLENFDFPASSKVDFEDFEELYRKCWIPQVREYSAELVWYVIYTYIRGHGTWKQDFTPEDYERSSFINDERLGIDTYRTIYEYAWKRFYANELVDSSKDGRKWDQLSLVHYLRAHLEGSNWQQSYIAVFCDEAQDFTKSELELLFMLSAYAGYHIAENTPPPVPVVFAGDPNQTVNPTGFNIKRVQNLVNERREALYGKKHKKGNVTSELPINYRSAPYIVNFANQIQVLKGNLCGLPLQLQEASDKHLVRNPEPHSFHLYYGEKLKEAKREVTQLQTIIVPSELRKVEEYADEVFSKDMLKSPFAAKGSEYDTVVLYKFGHAFANRFEQPLSELMGQKMNLQQETQLAFFFTKLYVSITRAKKEIIILDDNKGYEYFWEHFESFTGKKSLNDEDNTRFNLGRVSFIKNNLESLRDLINRKARFAEDDAFEDLRKGLLNGEAGKLENAQSQFERIAKGALSSKREDYTRLAKLCEAQKHELKGEFLTAARIYKEAGHIFPDANRQSPISDNQHNLLKFGNATWCYWLSGNAWQELNEILTDFRTIDQYLQHLWGLRHLVVRVMAKDTALALTEFYTYRELAEKLFTDNPYEENKTAWIREFYKRLRQRAEDDLKLKRIDDVGCSNLADVLEKRRDLGNEDYIILLGRLHYERGNYKSAVSYWGRADVAWQGSELYKTALLKRAYEEKDVPEIIYRSYELGKYKEVITQYEQSPSLPPERLAEVSLAYVQEGLYEKAFHVSHAVSLERQWRVVSQKGAEYAGRYLEALITWYEESSEAIAFGRSAEEDQKLFKVIYDYIFRLGETADNKNLFEDLKATKLLLPAPEEGRPESEWEKYRRNQKIAEDKYDERGRHFVRKMRENENHLVLFSQIIRLIARSQMTFDDFAAIKEVVMISRQYRHRDMVFRNLVRYYLQHYYLQGVNSRKDLVNLFELAVALERTSDNRNEALQFYSEIVFGTPKLLDTLPPSMKDEFVAFAQRRWVFHWKERELLNKREKGELSEEIDILMNEFRGDWKQYQRKYPNYNIGTRWDWGAIDAIEQTPILPKIQVVAKRTAIKPKPESLDSSPLLVEEDNTSADFFAEKPSSLIPDTHPLPSYLHEIALENFKQFKGTTVVNMGQFNLVLGENNVGKTSFLEALAFSEDSVEAYLNNLLYIYACRNGYEDFGQLTVEKFIEIFANVGLPNILQTISVRIGESSWQLKLQPEGRGIALLANDLNRHSVERLASRNFTELRDGFLDEAKLKDKFFPIIPFGQGYGTDIVKFYSAQIADDTERNRELVESLRVFIPNITDIRYAKGGISIFEEGRSKGLPLSQYGEGANKLFRILIQIIVAKNTRLMIDEIDAGIHRWRFPLFWETVLMAADRHHVQLFATTHNVECVGYFAKVLENEKLAYLREHARTITFYKTKKGELKSLVRKYESFDSAVNDGINIMGG